MHWETSQLKACFSEILHIYEQGGKEKGQGDMWVDAGNSGRVSDLPCGVGQPGRPCWMLPAVPWSVHKGDTSRGPLNMELAGEKRGSSPGRAGREQSCFPVASRTVELQGRGYEKQGVPRAWGQRGECEDHRRAPQ